METLQISNPKARKEHRCDYCNGKIEKGEKYQNSTHVHDDLYTWKAHLSCQELAEKMEMFKDCPDGVTEGDFSDFVNDYYFDFLKDEGDDYDNTHYHYRLEKVKNKFLE